MVQAVTSAVCSVTVVLDLVYRISYAAVWARFRFGNGFYKGPIGMVVT